MFRQKELAVKLLSLIEEHDIEGAGLDRSEIMAWLKLDAKAKDAEQLDHWNTVDYHLRLLATAGFIVYTPSKLIGDTETDNFELTWSGHEYLDGNRPEASGGFFGGGWVS
ncbi:DUF2513 domain-containing protein [Pseudomonas alabamensis]|uniref:DUF2513 domain-containing protein n=1 Tax=Pseudomonas alabamensis TaxID=3064349 RepID=UPI0021D7D5E8|nr:DUF2513 domain-containing protein [Pseudomonas entomophila]